MPSTFTGLNTAYTGLLASNAALNTTANNISNAETKGYSRQAVVQEATQAIRVFTKYGCVGAGVDVIAVERVRDEFFDTKYWENNSKLGEYSTKQYYNAQFETYFSDNEKVTGFNSVFDNMYKALDEVLKNPKDATTKAQFISYANSFTEYFNNMSVQLQNMQKDCNEEIKIQVDKISTISQQLGILNAQINTIEVSGNTANELRDQRALLVDELSKIVHVEVSELPMYDQNNQKTDCTRYVVNICGGINLVDNEITHSLSCVAREDNEKVNQSDADGLYDIYLDGEQEFNLYNASMGGTLRSLIDLRDGNNGEYFHGVVKDVYKDMYKNALGEGEQRSYVKVEVTSENLVDFTKTTLSDTGVVTLDNSKYHYDSFNFIQETDSKGETKYYYEFILAKEETVNRSAINKNSVIGGNVSYQGIPYYMSQMNEWVRNFAMAFNDILTENGVDARGDQALNLFAADCKVDDTQYTFTAYEDALEQYNNDVSKRKDTKLKISNESDSYYKLTSATFNIADYMKFDAELLATHSTKYDASSDSAVDITEKLMQLKTDKSLMSFRGCSARDFLQCVLSDVALNANSANTFTTNYTSLEVLIGNQRTSIQGVDNDEEAVDLVKYQNAYNLSSKMVQTLTEVYDRLILQTGV